MKILVALAFALSCLALSFAAFAMTCTTNTIVTSDGKLVICTTCCTTEGYCSTICN